MCLSVCLLARLLVFACAFAIDVSPLWIVGFCATINFLNNMSMVFKSFSRLRFIAMGMLSTQHISAPSLPPAPPASCRCCCSFLHIFAIRLSIMVSECDLLLFIPFSLFILMSIPFSEMVQLNDGQAIDQMNCILFSTCLFNVLRAERCINNTGGTFRIRGLWIRLNTNWCYFNQ